MNCRVANAAFPTHFQNQMCLNLNLTELVRCLVLTSNMENAFFVLKFLKIDITGSVKSIRTV